MILKYCVVCVLYDRTVLLTPAVKPLTGFAGIPPRLPPQSFPRDSFLRKLEFGRSKSNGQLYHHGQKRFP